MNFQWDALLLEAGFLSVFLAPFRLLPSRRSQSPLSPWAHFLLRWLLFRLMFMSGVVKLPAGMNHGGTSPLSVIIMRRNRCRRRRHGGRIWLLPGFTHFQRLSCSPSNWSAASVVRAPPITSDRRYRFDKPAAVDSLHRQLLFFNLLTFALCLLSVDDAVWPRLARRTGMIPRSEVPPGLGGLSYRLLSPCSVQRTSDLECLFSRSGLAAVNQCALRLDWSFRSLNGYGLFRVMTENASRNYC